MRGLYMLFLVVLVTVFCMPQPGQADEGTLLKVVVLSRHGVRSPTQHRKVLEAWSRKEWPKWPVAQGELTDRGARLVTAMWSNLRENLRDSKLLTGAQCPEPGSIFVRADVDERTMATARAILDGLAPSCPTGFAVLNGKVDPLFHPVKAGLYKYDPVPAATNVLTMTPGGLDNLQAEMADAINMLGRISGPPPAETCRKFTFSPNCRLSQLPNAISVSPDGESIHLVGCLGMASSMAEIYLLEYAQWPEMEAGWGSVNSTVLSHILPVHARVFDVVNRAPQVAWASGSPLLREITAALNGSHHDSRYNDAKVVVFVGHDTNIANIGSLLGANWQASGYPVNGIPPAGAIFFELWERNGQKHVALKFRAQPLQALHRAFAADGSSSWAENAFPQAQSARHDLSAFAPEEAIMNRPPQEGLADLELGAFIKLVERVTNGAPVAPKQSPRMDFRPVAPKP